MPEIRLIHNMERRRLQQQRIKQQRFCVSQQDLTPTIARIKLQRRAIDDNLLDISSSSSCSIQTVTIPSVSQLVKEFEARTASTPYISTEDVTPKKNVASEQTTDRTMNVKVNEQFTGDKEQIILENERSKHDLSSSTSSSYHSAESTNNNTTTTTTDMSIRNTRFNEIRAKEVQLNHALADLMSLSNDADISSSISSSSRSLINNSQRRRASSTHGRSSSISASIALLNNLLETFDMDIEKSKKETNEKVKPINMFCVMMSDNICANCQQSFATNEQIVNAAGHVWHTKCFVCAQCFQPFDNGLYFEHEGRKYCERDFQMLFAPYCAECKQAIVGRVIRALQKCFHPDCFRCQLCQTLLLEIGFSKNNGRVLCRDCHTKEKVKDPNNTQQICSTCQKMIENKYIRYKGECYHAYHFQCSTCGIDLDENAREVQGSLYCLPCHNKLDLPVCAACRRLIDDRVISALGKQWHVEHFCCARCAQPFRGSKHFENKGLAYCENDYHFLFGPLCFTCNRTITEGAYTACNKKYCVKHFACSICETRMNEKSKFYDVDATPVCKQCYGKIPTDIRKSLQQHQKKKQLSSVLKPTAV